MAISNLGVTHGDRQWLRENLRASETEETFPTEIAMVGGLMKWLTQERRRPYLTRSALVANVAVCLKTVGYLIDSVTLWNGCGEIPTVVGSGAVILALGGSVETDSLMLDHAEVIGESYTHHYHYSTAGSMLSNALDNQSDVAPEVFQTCFEGVYSHMESHLAFRWTLAADTSCPLKAVAQWRHLRKAPSPISTRLAAIHFPFCANYMAPCYELMADEESLREVLSSKDAISGVNLVPTRLALFRVVTASIVISIWSRLGGKDFKTLRHATTLQLRTSDWLEQACHLLDKKMSLGLDFYDVACGVAVIHAASDPGKETRSSEKIIGWRSGVYAVVPALLLEMAPTRAALGVQCIDYYWANAMVHSDGSIRSATKPALMQSYHESDVESPNENSTVQSLSEPHIAPPVMSSADVPLYLNIERPVHYGESDLCLCGRLYGQ